MDYRDFRFFASPAAPLRTLPSPGHLPPGKNGEADIFFPSLGAYTVCEHGYSIPFLSGSLPAAAGRAWHQFPWRGLLACGALCTATLVCSPASAALVESNTMTSPAPTSLRGAHSATLTETPIPEGMILSFPDTLLERYMARVQSWVRCWACGRLPWHDLLDAEQEVFCALLKELGRCDPERRRPPQEEQLPRFLHHVLHRRFLNSQRSARRFARRQERLAAAVRRSLRLDWRDPAQLLEEAECVACLHTAISDLEPLEYCLCVGFLAETPLAVTARQLGLRYAVALRCWRGALAKLRARLAGWR
jgi:hypothetical protein